MCMSWRQPESKRAGKRAEKIARTQSARLAAGADLRDLHFGFIDAKRLEAFQELPGCAHIEFLVPRFDAQKKAAASGHGKAWHVEKRVIRRRQAIHRQHAKRRRQRRAENRRLERDGNERGPAIEWFAVHVQWETHDVRIPLQKKAASRAEHPRQKYD